MNTINSAKYQLSVHKAPNPKRRYLIALAVFFIAMYFMMFAEHYFESHEIANVDGSVLENHALTHWLEGTGVVSGKEIIAYVTPAGRMLQKGDEVLVKAAGSDQIPLQISRLSYDAEKNIITLHFDIDPDDYEDGAQVLVTREQKTRKYPCIPVNAVHKDEMDNDFVYLVQEKKSILGNELICKMKYINVFLRDEEYAAIDLDQAGLNTSDLFIVHSDREITEGSKIHLLE